MKAVVIGTGIAGTASTRLLVAHKAEVVTVDDVTLPRARLPAGVELVVPSPGVPPRHPLLAEARRRRIPIWSELELAARWWDGPMVAVTGTNGKSSVVTMVAASLNGAGLRARAVGNIGDPIGTAVVEEPASTVLVVEASSFQLHYCHAFAPDAAAVLNVDADHLDWHGTAAAYRRAKGRILSAQPPGAWAVVNAGDRGAAALGRRVPARVCRYRRGRPLAGGIGIEGGWLVADEAAPGGGGALLDQGVLEGRPPHELDNALAVLALVRAVAPDPGPATVAAGSVVASFAGLPHMRRPVAVLEGITFIDDSKATNPSAAVASILASDSVVLVAGGRNKGVDLAPMAAAGRGRVRAVIGLGESGPELMGLFAAEGVPAERATGMEDAVKRAAAWAHPGDTVLLAPGCASFDMFPGQAARGDAFASAVRALEEAAAPGGRERPRARRRPGGPAAAATRSPVPDRPGARARLEERRR